MRAPARATGRMGARRGATTGGAAGFTRANPACTLMWQGWRALVSQKITPGLRQDTTETKDRSAGSSRSPCLEHSPEGPCQGSGCPVSGRRTGLCPPHRPQCCQEELWSSSTSWKAGEAREHRLATEVVAHLGVIWALPSRPSAGLFLPSGITGQATWAGWLPRLNPFMWLPSNPAGMGPTGVTPDGVGWPLPFLVSEGGRKNPFPTDGKHMSAQ